MTAPDMFDVLTRLENQIISINGIADALSLMATSEEIGNGRKALAYLGGQLTEHLSDAREAFDDIFHAMHGKPADKGDAA
jgi:hypothetical protein